MLDFDNTLIKFAKEKIECIDALLNAIKEHDLTTVSQVVGLMNNYKDAWQESIEARQYEAEAKADHNSEEQFNHE